MKIPLWSEFVLYWMKMYNMFLVKTSLGSFNKTMRDELACIFRYLKNKSSNFISSLYWHLIHSRQSWWLLSQRSCLPWMFSVTKVYRRSQMNTIHSYIFRKNVRLKNERIWLNLPGSIYQRRIRSKIKYCGQIWARATQSSMSAFDKCQSVYMSFGMMNYFPPYTKFPHRYAITISMENILTTDIA